MGSSPARDSALFRARRLATLFAGSVISSRGLSGKWAMVRAIWGWFRARLGHPARSHEVTLKIDGLQMRIDASRGEITSYWELWYENAYESLPGFKALDDSVVVDVGGNAGFYAVRQARRARCGRVITFEPSPSVYRRLSANVRDNGADNIVAVNAAIGRAPGVVHFLERALSINCKVVPEATAETIDVPCETLDTALQRLGVDRVDLLKIDTEGHEQAVLAGAAQTLSRVKHLVLEVHGDADAEALQVEQIAVRHGLRPAAREGCVVYFERPPAAEAM